VLEKGSMWGDCVLPFIVETVPFELDYPEDIPRVELRWRCRWSRSTGRHELLLS